MSTSPSSPAGSPFGEGDLAQIAVFPLPSVSLFPHTVIPLHIFEPRYRQMVEDALDDRMLIAMAMPREPGPDETPERLPALHGIAGAGRLVHHERLDDGRFNILLRGVGRVRILAELPKDRLYRRVSAEWVPDVVDDAEECERLALSIQATTLVLAQQGFRPGASLARMISEESKPAAIADLLCAVLFREPGERHALLAEPRLVQRLECVRLKLAEWLAGPPSGTVH